MSERFAVGDRVQCGCRTCRVERGPVGTVAAVDAERFEVEWTAVVGPVPEDPAGLTVVEATAKAGGSHE